MNKIRKTVCLLLSFCFLTAFIPVTAQAGDDPDEFYVVYNESNLTLYACYGEENDEKNGIVRNANGQTVYGRYDKPDNDDAPSFFYPGKDFELLALGYEIPVRSVVFLDVITAKQMVLWFSFLTNLTGITGLDRIDAGAVKNMYGAFLSCSALKTLDLRSLDTRNTENMQAMFANCKKLTTLNVGSFDTRKVTNMQAMFAGCSALTSLDLSSFTVTDGTHMGGMFEGCTALSSLTLGENFRFTFLDPLDYNYFREVKGHKEGEEEIDPPDLFQLIGMDVDLTTPGLPEPPQNDDYTGFWVLEGSDDYRLTSEQLMAQYDGATMAGTWEWEHKPDSLAGATVTAQNQTYTGKALTPAPVVTLNGEILVEGKDYTVSYDKNTDVGTATVTVTAMGKYRDSASGTFRIFSAPLDDAYVSVGSETYTGRAVNAAVTVQKDGNTLEQGTDYTVFYKNNVNAGTAEVTVIGIGSYTGSVSASFSILAKDLSGARVDVPEQTYTGEALTPPVTVSLNGVKLTRDTDYTVQYINNTDPTAEAVAMITGKGNYTGSAFGTFCIKSDAQPETYDLFSASVFVEDQDFTGEALTPPVTVMMGNKTLQEGTDYTVSYYNNTRAGTADVTVIGVGKYNGALSATFEINALDLSNAKIAVEDQTHTGAALKPDAVVTLNGVKLTAGRDYSVKYANNVEPGAAVVQITGKGNYTGSAIGSFRIEAEAVVDFLLGDVDNNGKVEAADARYTLRAAVGLDDTAVGLDFSKTTNRCFLAADVTKDKTIQAADARLILRAAVGLEVLS
ncbi:MAG: BspA family leucine-rich repeat surface protein [Clostridia bacterium]|nr:BspA family leucine-rich repeat surface protein [Clostridia bacterium]